MGDPLSVAASIAGLVTLADAVFIRTFRYVKNVKGADKEIATLASELQSLSGVLHSLHLRISELDGDEHASTATYRPELVGSCLRLLVKARDRLEKHNSGKPDKEGPGSRGKMKWPFSMTETKDLIADIERQKSTLTVALSADNMTAAQAILSTQQKLLSDVDEIKVDLKRRKTFEANITDFVTNAIMDEKQREVIRFFGSVDPSERHQTSLSLRHPNTGMWLLQSDEFQEWLNKQSSRLWLSGIPGAGKTVLASAAIESAIEQCCHNNSDKGLAYFYCDYKDERSQDLPNILGSIAAQLARQNRQSLDILQKHYDTFHHPGRSSLSTARPPLTQVIQEMSVYFTEVFIIVDALDECGQKVTTVVESLASLNAKDGCNIKTLFLSRDEFAIRCSLEDTFAHIPIAARSHDLKLYVASQIETRMNSGKLRIKNAALKDEIMEKLVNGSGGMFRWVACQIDHLCKLPHDTARRQALEDLPPDLDSTYERILYRVNEQGEYSRALVRKTIQWIIFAKIPLSIEQLREALAVEDGSTELNPDSFPDEESILDYCSSLIRKSVRGNRLELSHFTVEEYLKSSRIRSNDCLAQYRVDPVSDTLSLSMDCLRYLNMEEFSHDLPSTLVDWEDRHKTYPFRMHAVEYWHGYAMTNANHLEDNCLFGLCRKLFHPDKTFNFLSYAQDTFVHVLSATLYKGQIDDDDIARHPFEGTTPLHYAAIHHLVRLQEWLLSIGCDVNRVSSLGSPLHCAMLGINSIRVFPRPFKPDNMPYLSSGQKDSVELLFRSGADWAIPFRDGENHRHSTLKYLFSILWEGSRDETVPFLKLFLDAGAVLVEEDLAELTERFKSAPDQFRVVLETFQWGNVENSLIGQFLDLAADIESSAPLEWSAGATNCGKEPELLRRMEEAVAGLRLAARFDQTETVSQLIGDNNLDINHATEDSGKTALHVAASNGSIGSLKILLDAGADVNQADFSGQTALHFCGLGRDRAVVDLLVDRGGNDERRDNKGRTVWDVAAGCNNVDVLETLLAKHERKETKSLELILNTSALKNAAQSGSDDAVLLLVDHMENLNCIFEDGTTIAHHCGKLSMSTCRILLGKGLDVGAMTRSGKSPLHTLFSSTQGYSEDDQDLIPLLAKSATINLRDSEDYTPLDRLCAGAFEFDPEDAQFMLKSLLEKGADPTETKLPRKFPLDVLLNLEANCTKEGASAANVSALIEIFLEHILARCVTVHDTFWNRALLWALHRQEWDLAENILRQDRGVVLCSTSGSEQKSLLEAACKTALPASVFQSMINRVDHSALYRGNSVSGLGLLHLLCSKDSEASVECLNMLLDAGVDVNMTCSQNNTPLLHAAYSGKVDHVKALLQHNADAYITDRWGWNVVHLAACSGSPEILCLIRETTAGVDWKRCVPCSYNCDHIEDPTETTVLHLAVQRPIKTLEYLLELEEFTDINCADNNGLTPLLLAAAKGAADCVKLLIQKGSAINAANTKGETALHHSACQENERISILLLSSGADVDAVNLRGQTALHYAASLGYDAVVQALIKHGATQVTDLDGLTPEINALIEGHTSTIDILRNCQSKTGGCQSTSVITRSAKLSEIFKSSIIRGNHSLCEKLINSGFRTDFGMNGCAGCTAIVMALERRQLDIARTLIAARFSTAGETCRSGSYPGFTPIHLAARDEDFLDILRLLLVETSSEGDFHTAASVHPLHIAAARSNVTGIKCLLEYYAGDSETKTPKLTSETGKMAHDRRNKGSLNVKPSISKPGDSNIISAVRTIVNLRTSSRDLDIPWILAPGKWLNEWGSVTPLHIAVYHNDLHSAEVLLSYGADVNCRTELNRAPLHLAAEIGSISLSKLLLQHGANLEARNEQYQTPAMIALRSGHNDLFQELVDRGADIFSRGEFNNSIIDEMIEFSSKDTIALYMDKISAHWGAPRSALWWANAEYNPGLLGLLLNTDIFLSHLDSFDGVGGNGLITRHLTSLLRMLLRRFDKNSPAIKSINERQADGAHNPLCVAASVCNTDAMQLLLDYGADVNTEGHEDGTALMVACKASHLPAVEFLVRKGARIAYCKDGDVCNAIAHAERYPEIKQWLLVDRYTAQRKIDCTSEADATARECRPWSGLVKVEVPLKFRYGRFEQESLFDYAVRLARRRKDFEGKLLVWGDDVPIPFTTLDLSQCL